MKTSQIVSSYESRWNAQSYDFDYAGLKSLGDALPPGVSKASDAGKFLRDADQYDGANVYEAPDGSMLGIGYDDMERNFGVFDRRGKELAYAAPYSMPNMTLGSTYSK